MQHVHDVAAADIAPPPPPLPHAEKVSNDGTVPFRTGERIAFTYLISQKYTGETAQVDILRDGKEMSLEIG